MTTSGERYWRSACIDTDMWQQLVATWAEFQHSKVYCATDQCRKRQEACVHAEGGHCEHLLWRCLPNIPVATHHNRFFSEPSMPTHNRLFSEPPTFEGTQQTFSQMKKFCILQVRGWHFQMGWTSGLQFVFFCGNINNQNYVWIILLKWLFWIFRSKFVTSDRWDGQV